MSRLLILFCKAKSGATAIEYGLIAALIAVVLIASFQNLGTRVKATFTTISTAL